MIERRFGASILGLARGCMLALTVALVFAPPPNAATFTYTNPACSSFTVSGTPPTQTVTCVTSPGLVPVCAPSATPTSPAIGQQTTISANCTNGPTSYTWTGGGCAATTAGATCSVTKSRSTTVRFTITASNASGTGPTAQISVTWK